MNDMTNRLYNCIKQNFTNLLQELLESKYLKDVMSKYGNIDVANISLDPNDASPAQNFVPRSSYTNQIMEILKNVSRQKEETARVSNILCLFLQLVFLS